MTDLSRRIRAVPPSPTFAIKAKARALAAAGRDIINLSTGEPDGLPPAEVLTAASASLEAGEHRYTPVAGLPELREAVADSYRRRWGLPCEPGQVLVTHGGKQALFNLCLAAFDPGDRVVVLNPAWVTYIPQLMLAGLVPVEVSCRAEDGFLPDPAAVREAARGARGIILNSPNNPTGAVIGPDLLRELATIAVEADLLVIADEIYDELYYGDEPRSIATLGPEIAARTILVNAVSKTFAMTGWRVGWMVASPTVVEATAIVQGHSTSGVSAIAQRAAVGALSADRGFLADIRRGLARRRDVLADGLAAVEGFDVGEKPGGAFYLFPRIDRLFGRRTTTGVLQNADDVAEWLLEAAGVAAVPGTGFGAPQCIRLAYPVRSELLAEAVVRIAGAVEGLD